MNILVYGAGVIGSIVAARLQGAGHPVTVLARGPRRAALEQAGLVLENARHPAHPQIVRPAHITDRLSPDDRYDLVIVAVRKNQLADILPVLAASRHPAPVLVLGNNAAGPAALIAAVGPERALLGFVLAGGVRVGGIVRWASVPGRHIPLVLGAAAAPGRAALRRLVPVLRAAGFGVQVCPQMDAWLKTHAALVNPVAQALYLANGDPWRLAHTPDGLVLLVRAVQEGLAVLAANGIPITPRRNAVYRWLPEAFLAGLLRQALHSPITGLMTAGHANAARDEMAHLAAEFQELAEGTDLLTPARDALRRYLDPTTPPLPAGSAHIQVAWAGGWIGLGALAGLASIMIWHRPASRPAASDIPA